MTAPPGPPDKAALIAGDVTVTFSELDARVARVHGALSSLGVDGAAPIAVMLHNSIEFFEVSLGAARAGCQVVPFEWSHSNCYRARARAAERLAGQLQGQLNENPGARQ